LDLYQYLTLAALVATTAYSLVNLFSSLRITLSTTGKSKKSTISRMKILSDKINRFYETFLPSYRLGDRNEVRVAIANVMFIFGVLFVILSREVVSFNEFEAISIPWIPPFLFYLLFPLYVFGSTKVIIESRTSVASEDASVEFAKKSGDLVWRMTSMMLFASLGTLYYEGFLVENLSASVASQWPFYVVIIAAGLAVAVPGFAIIGHSKTGLEVVASLAYFSQAGHHVQLEIAARVNGGAVFDYSGSLLSTGDSIYIRRPDGFVQEIPWKGIISLAVKE
jgi:hypothetical protein